jgi:hypothetical protein
VRRVVPRLRGLRCLLDSRGSVFILDLVHFVLRFFFIFSRRASKRARVWKYWRSYAGVAHSHLFDAPGDGWRGKLLRAQQGPAPTPFEIVERPPCILTWLEGAVTGILVDQVLTIQAQLKHAGVPNRLPVPIAGENSPFLTSNQWHGALPGEWKWLRQAGWPGQFGDDVYTRRSHVNLYRGCSVWRGCIAGDRQCGTQE